MARKLALVAGTFLASLIVAEIILRIGGISHPSFHQADPLTGMALRPEHTVGTP